MPPSGAGAGPSPRPRLYRRMSMLLSGTPTLPTLLRRIPARFCRRPPCPRLHRDTCALLPAPPTPPAPAALLPRPLSEQGSARAYIRGTAVSGSSPGSPHAVDRVDIATGGGADGEGELVPPPLSLTLPRSHISPPPHPCLRRQATHTLLPAVPTPPAPAALLPRPLSEQGSARAYIRRAAVPGFSPGSPCAPDHGGYRHGGDDSCKD